jgi:hypothetical protein
MDSLTDNHQIGRLDIVDTGRRRRWTDEEKRKRCCEPTFRIAVGS